MWSRTGGGRPGSDVGLAIDSRTCAALRSTATSLAFASLCSIAACGRLGFEISDGIDGDAPALGDSALDDSGAGDGPDDSPRYRANAVRFQRFAGDYAWTGTLQNTVNGPRGTVSVWLRFNGGDDEQQLVTVAQVAGIGGIIRTSANRTRVLLYTCAAIPLLDLQSVGTQTVASGWVHILASWDLTTGRAQLYVNDIPDKIISTNNNGSICYDSWKWGIGGLSTGELEADVADLFATLTTSLDLDVEANRRKFRDAQGKPVDLGSNCTSPLGSKPAGCFRGDVATWHVNKGTGGGFTLEGDGLVASPTSPSD